MIRRSGRLLIVVMSNLSLDITMLSTVNQLGNDTGLPGRSTEVRNTVGILEHGLNLLEGLTSGLREQEENVDESTGIEDTEEQVGLPLDIGESNGGEHAESSVESPVSGGRKSHTLTTEAEREQLWGISPGNGTPGRSERGDEEICAGNESLGGSASDLHGLSGNMVDTAGNNFTLGSKNTRVGKHPDGHKKGADHECRTTTPAINEEKSRDSHEHIDDVLNRGGEESSVSSVTGHLENVGNVVHHDVHTSELRPNLAESSDHGTVNHVGLEEIQVCNVGVSALKLAHVLDILEFVRDEGMVRITLAVDEGENGLAIFPSVLAGEPTRRFG